MATAATAFRHLPQLPAYNPKITANHSPNAPFCQPPASPPRIPPLSRPMPAIPQQPKRRCASEPVPSSSSPVPSQKAEVWSDRVCALAERIGAADVEVHSEPAIQTAQETNALADTQFRQRVETAKSTIFNDPRYSRVARINNPAYLQIHYSTGQSIDLCPPHSNQDLEMFIAKSNS